MRRYHYVCLSAIFLASSAALAQTDPAQQAPAPAAPSKWTAGPVQVSGLVDAYYSMNFNHPESRTNNLRNFDVRANSLSLNMAKLEFQKSAEPVGFRLDLGFGRAFEIFHATEPGLNGTSVFRNIMQAYVTYAPKDAGGLTLDFGKFVTSAGAEPTETHLNWNYSRALIYANGPYYHFGLRVAKPLTSNFTVGFQLVNGWNNVEDNNSGKTMGFTTALTTKKVSWFQTYYTGPEKTNINDGWRNFYDTVVTLSPTDKASFYVNFDYGRENNPGEKAFTWATIGVAGHFQLTDVFSLSPRWEIYDDKDGFITGKAQQIKEFTMTAEFKHSQGFLTRLEYRRDYSNQPYFDRGFENGVHKNQDTVLAGFVVYFGE